MIDVKICLMMLCDKCHDDTRDSHYISIENKDDYDILNVLYKDFLEMAKKEGWVCHDGKCLCPACKMEVPDADWSKKEKNHHI